MTSLDKKRPGRPEWRRNDEMHQFRNLHRYAYHAQTAPRPGLQQHSLQDCTSDSDVPILKLLSKGLRSELQFTRYESALERLTFLRNLMSSDKQTPQEGKVLQSLATKALYTEPWLLIVEFAQNDVVFCQGGIADAAFLVLSDEQWVAEVCLWMVAKDIGRSVAVEEMRQQATFFAQMVVEDLNTQQVEDLTDVQINDLEDHADAVAPLS
ncbi:hypothetical protein AK812_SmicGene19775 [Symbiodinium microadriaticum]|uniref:Uncharacterized protein n=1 Tax=Symbiodinium microadriaticum TaxID=2951 RepID=A0A1Q9DRR3_SYMMI|nr:hypothetical protein AK812_SmicGene19775 [Symbiodinium microadriaticum]